MGGIFDESCIRHNNVYKGPIVVCSRSRIVFNYSTKTFCPLTDENNCSFSSRTLAHELKTDDDVNLSRDATKKRYYSLTPVIG